jgi:DNA-binding NarL/FixJ family response regulator
VPPAKPRRIRIHVVHESRMLAEAISVKLKTLLPGASVDGWTKSWHVYNNRDQSVADVVLLDNELSNGTPTAAKVGTLVPHGTGIVVIGSTTYPPAIRRVLAAGAHAYVLQSDPSETVAAAVASASRGDVTVSDSVAELIADDTAPAVPALTLRELEIASAYLSGSGASVPETAARFGLSAETVRTHIAHVRRKYSLDGETVTKMELRRRLIRDGWILT